MNQEELLERIKQLERAVYLLIRNEDLQYYDTRLTNDERNELDTMQYTMQYTIQGD